MFSASGVHGGTEEVSGDSLGNVPEVQVSANQRVVFPGAFHTSHLIHLSAGMQGMRSCDEQVKDSLLARGCGSRGTAGHGYMASPSATELHRPIQRGQ